MPKIKRKKEIKKPNREPDVLKIGVDAKKALQIVKRLIRKKQIAKIIKIIPHTFIFASFIYITILSKNHLLGDFLYLF